MIGGKHPLSANNIIKLSSFFNSPLCDNQYSIDSFGYMSTKWKKRNHKSLLCNLKSRPSTDFKHNQCSGNVVMIPPMMLSLQDFCTVILIEALDINNLLKKLFWVVVIVHCLCWQFFRKWHSQCSCLF